MERNKAGNNLLSYIIITVLSYYTIFNVFGSILFPVLPPSDWQRPAGDTVALIFIILRPLFQLITETVHELGHLVSGLIHGCQFISFRIASRILMRDETGRLGWKRRPLRGVKCLMLPPQDSSGFPWVRYQLSGLVAILLVSIPLAIGLQFVFVGWLRAVLGSFVAASLVDVYFKAVPLQDNEGANDGMKALELWRHPSSRAAEWKYLKISALALNSRLKDMPEQLFEVDDEAVHNGTIGADALVLRELWAMDRHDFDEADRQLEKIRKGNCPISRRHKQLMMCDQVCIDCLMGRFSEITDTGLKKYMRIYDDYPPVLRTNYLIALYRNDLPAQQKIIERIKAHVWNLQFPMALKSESEIMDAAQQLLSQRKEVAVQEDKHE